MVSKGRKYVSRVQRDGSSTATPSRKRRHDPDKLNTCFVHGSEAEQKGIPRYANPYKDMRAKVWTLAWNTQHVLGKTSGCRGCKLCLVGTGVASEKDLETYDRLVKGTP